MPHPPPPSVLVQSALTRANDLVEWLAEKVDPVSMNGDRRYFVPGLLFDLAMEHHASIIELIGSGRHASAFALVRPELEALLRGLWLHHCATQEQFDKFIKCDKIAQQVEQMVLALERLQNFSGGELSFAMVQWKAMHSYTHGGTRPISRRLKNRKVTRLFNDDEVLEVITFSGTIALLSLGYIAELAGMNALGLEVTDKIGEP